MPVPSYLSITGATQGPITQGASTAESVGNKYQDNHADEILVEAFEHSLHIPTDPQSGQPSGQRVHNALQITKCFDKTSPLLYQALANGERLTTCEIKWYRTSKEGKQEHYFTTSLEDAVIVDIRSYMPNCQDPKSEAFTHLEDVDFRYRKITWTHEGAGTSGSDDWRNMDES